MVSIVRRGLHPRLVSVGDSPLLSPAPSVRPLIPSRALDPRSVRGGARLVSCRGKGIVPYEPSAPPVSTLVRPSHRKTNDRRRRFVALHVCIDVGKSAVCGGVLGGSLVCADVGIRSPLTADPMPGWHATCELPPPRQRGCRRRFPSRRSSRAQQTPAGAVSAMKLVAFHAGVGGAESSLIRGIDSSIVSCPMDPTRYPRHGLDLPDTSRGTRKMPCTTWASR